MRPVIPEKAGDTPQHTKRFDGASGLTRPHVLDLPAKLIEDITDRQLCRGLAAIHRPERFFTSNSDCADASQVPSMEFCPDLRKPLAKTLATSP